VAMFISRRAGWRKGEAARGRGRSVDFWEAKLESSGSLFPL
jgi:hypothetical protein